MKLSNINVSYGKKTALNNLSLEIKKNSGVTAILGPNGAGKSTLINIIVGNLNTYSGTKSVDGTISYMPDKPFLYSDMTVKKAMKVFSASYSDFDKSKAQQILNHFHIDFNMKMKEASKGMSEQVHLALVLSRNVDFYILDEPLSALDPINRDYLLEVISNYRNKDSSLIIVTHLIQDLSQLFNRAVFIKSGLVVNDFSLTGKNKTDQLYTVYRRLYK